MRASALPFLLALTACRTDPAPKAPVYVDGDGTPSGGGRECAVWLTGPAVG